MAPLVSIVTPFHNTADDLAECIESVLGQTYENFEYILLNNASTDGSAEVAERYAARDSRIRYVSTERLLPQVENYNRVLDYMSAESAYCKYAQADDVIFPRCVEEMVALAEAAPEVGIVSAYSSFGRKVVLTGLDIHERVVSGREVCRRYFLEGLWVFGSPTALLYRTQVVREREPFYRTDRPNEDTDVCFEILRTWDLGFVHQVLSYMRPNTGSISPRSAQLLTWELADLLYVERHARHFLDPAEFAALEAETWSSYYQQLGGRALRNLRHGAPDGFWDFHREGLASIGAELSMRRMVVGAAITGARRVTTPLRKLSTVRGIPAYHRRRHL